MSNYVHFYWAGARLPLFSSCQNLMRWSAYLGMRGSACLEKGAVKGKTKFIPIFWCSDDVFNDIVQHHATIAYSEARAYISENWSEAFEELQGDLPGINKRFWTFYVTKETAYIPMNFVIVNLDEWLHDQASTAPIFGQLHEYYLLYNRHRLYTTPKNIISFLLIWRYSGFYFDIDIEPSKQFLFSTELLDKPYHSFCLSHQLDPQRLILKQLKMEFFYDKEKSIQAIETSAEPVLRDDIQMLFGYFKNEYSWYPGRRHDIEPFEDHERDILSYQTYVRSELEKDKQSFYYGLKNFDQDNPAASAKIMRQYRTDPCRTANLVGTEDENFLKNTSKLDSLRDEISRQFITVLIDPEIVGVLSKPLAQFYHTYFFDLFKQVFIYAPSSLQKTGYQELQAFATSAATIEKHRLAKQETIAWKAESAAFPLRGFHIKHKTTTFLSKITHKLRQDNYDLYQVFNALFLVTNAWELCYENKNHTSFFIALKQNRHLKIKFTFIDYQPEVGNIFSIEFIAGTTVRRRIPKCQEIRVMSHAYNNRLSIYYKVEDRVVYQDTAFFQMGNFLMPTYSLPTFTKLFSRYTERHQARFAERPHYSFTPPKF